MSTDSLCPGLGARCPAALLLGVLVGGLLGLAGLAPAAAQDRIYVDADATGAADGSSWTDAYPSLQNALLAAAAGDSVWVAAGTYYPDEGGGDLLADSPTESFRIPDTVAVYGGFVGDETRLSARDVTTNRTSLSGDVTQDDSDPDGDDLIQPGDVSGDNSYHVVEGSASGGRLDGVYVTAGDASGSTVPNDRGGGLYVPLQVDLLPAMTVTNTRFVGNRAAVHGGAIYVDGADAVFSNVEMVGNETASGDGGGLHVVGTDFGNVWMANVLFSGNRAAGNGGAVFHRGGTLELFNTTAAQNQAAADGGGLYASTGAAGMVVERSTLSGNTADGSGGQIYTDASLDLRTSILAGDTSSVGGTGSVSVSTPPLLDADPLFVDGPGPDGTAGTPDDDLRVVDNYATSGAGLALLVDTEATARPRLSSVTLVGNEALALGGGMLLSAGDGTLAPDFANVRVLGNRAAQAGAFGIGTGNEGVAAPTFANLLVSGNVSAADSAAAVFRNASSATLEPTFVNTTWAQNTAPADSLSALVATRDLDSEDFVVRVANSILWGNAARSTVAGDAEAVRIDSSVVRGGWDEPGDDNLDADPLFVNPPGPDGRPGTSDDSLQVLPGSPALEWGGSSFLPADATDLDRDGDRSERLPLDLSGEPRVQGDVVDAGAYEGASGTLPTITLTPPDEPPAPGTATPIDVTFPDDFAPSEGTFYYRPAGAPAFQTVGLDLGGVEGGATITVDVPGSAVTQRGVQYYVQATGPLTGRPEPMQLTAPTTAPTRTAFLPVRIGEVRAEGAFAPERYRMLTVPADLGGRSVFDLLETQYGPYDPRQWRVARWAPRDSSYRLGPEVGPLTPGQAAWFITADGDSLIVNDARSANAAGPRSLPLQPGWNQIGSPFSFPVAWADVQRPDAVRAPVAYDASRPRGERYRFAAETLRPWRGAFVYNAADTAVTIRVPPTEDTTATTDSRRPRTATTGTGGYRLQALATATPGPRRLQDRSTWLGFAEGAEAGFGPKDRAKPPAVGPHVRVHVVSENGPPLARSLRPPSAEGAAWTLRVGLHLGDELSSPQTVTVRFAEQGARPDGFERYVLDPARGERLSVSDPSVTVRLTPDRPTRRLRVIVGTEAFAEQTSGGTSLAVEETTLRTNAPNPFTEATTLSDQLAERQEVTIAIYDLLGRRVETLVDGPREAGVHRTTWRATGSGGQSLASGVYFCRMEAGSYAGTQKLVLVR